VGNLAPETLEHSVRIVFEKYGKIDEIRMQPDKGYAFVKFAEHSTATRAIIHGNGETIGVRTVRCSWGKEKSATETVPAPLPAPILPTPAAAAYPPYMAYPYMMYNYPYYGMAPGMPVPGATQGTTVYPAPTYPTAYYPPPYGGSGGGGAGAAASGLSPGEY